VRTDGTFVAWEYRDQPINRNPPIYVANLRDRSLVQAGPGALLDVDRGIVIWRFGGEVRGKDVTTGREFFVTSLNWIHVPAISNNRVVWFGIEGERRFLKMRDVSTMAEPVNLVEVPANMTVPRIEVDGDRVVWKEVTGDAMPKMRLRTTTLTGGTPFTIVENVLLVYEQFDVSDDNVVYVFAGSNGAATTRIVNLRTGENKIISTDNRLQQPTLDGRYVFWVNQRELTNAALSPTLRGYDVTTDSAFDLPVTGRIAMARARNGVIAWVRQESGDKSSVFVAQVAEMLPNARRSAPEVNTRDVRYFEETGHNLGFGFKTFWDRSGGLPVFGYPLTEELDQRNRDTGQTYTVQYFERQRYEYHPENANTPYTVLLGRLGVEALQRAGRDWQAEPKADPNAPHFFAATGHAIAPEFWDYWRTHGLEFGDAGVTEREALALFGYPVTEPRMEQNSSGDTVLTQWFERARFEYHPNNPESFNVLLGRLGADVLAGHGW
jgi:hypothetical protein